MSHVHAKQHRWKVLVCQITETQNITQQYLIDIQHVIGCVPNNPYKW